MAGINMQTDLFQANGGAKSKAKQAVDSTGQPKKAAQPSVKAGKSVTKAATGKAATGKAAAGESYTAADIEVLEGLDDITCYREADRLRPWR